jgi:small basic protein
MWIVSHLITGLALGVVYLMATKPNGWQSVLIVAIVGGLGAAVGAAGARVSSPQLQEQAPATA